MAASISGPHLYRTSRHDSIKGDQRDSSDSEFSKRLHRAQYSPPPPAEATVPQTAIASVRGRYHRHPEPQLAAQRLAPLTHPARRSAIRRSRRPKTIAIHSDITSHQTHLTGSSRPCRCNIRSLTSHPRFAASICGPHPRNHSKRDTIENDRRDLSGLDPQTAANVNRPYSHHTSRRDHDDHATPRFLALTIRHVHQSATQHDSPDRRELSSGYSTPTNRHQKTLEETVETPPYKTTAARAVETEFKLPSAPTRASNPVQPSIGVPWRDEFAAACRALANEEQRTPLLVPAAPSTVQPSTDGMGGEKLVAADDALTGDEYNSEELWEALALLEHDEPSDEELLRALATARNTPNTRGIEATPTTTPAPAAPCIPDSDRPSAGISEEEGFATTRDARIDGEWEGPIAPLIGNDDPSDDELWEVLAELGDSPTDDELREVLARLRDAGDQSDTETTPPVTNRAEVRATETTPAFTPPRTPKPVLPTTTAPEEENIVAAFLKQTNGEREELEEELLNALIHGDTNDPAERATTALTRTSPAPIPETKDDEATIVPTSAHPSTTARSITAPQDEAPVVVPASSFPLASATRGTGTPQVEALAMIPASGAALPPPFPSCDPGMTPLSDRLDAVSDDCNAARESDLRPIAHITASSGQLSADGTPHHVWAEYTQARDDRTTLVNLLCR
ncbi:hypothetical protein EDB85DRAFT_2153626 [Lactarius pseudohatsudake]|nr:hypothetical protein EDB85DRAFT_2153626 [Lactarius pseudohatsudake]